MRPLRFMFPVFMFALLTSAALLPSQAVEAQEDCTWSHTFDFTVDDGGWDEVDVLAGWTNPGATYSAGVGWTTVHSYTGGDDPRRSLLIDISFSETTFTYIKLYNTYTAGTFSPNTSAWTRRTFQVGAGNLSAFTVVNPGTVPATTEWTGSQTASYLFIHNTTSAAQSGSSFSGTGIITRIDLEGIGEVNPFSEEVSCAPEASFSSFPDSGAEPLEVEFTDTSDYEPTSWSWNFGDGSEAFTQNPTHTYTETGIYEVTLTACNDNGCDEATDTIYVTGGIGIPGGGFLYRPIQESDALAVAFGDGIASVDSDSFEGATLFPQPYDHTVLAFTNAPGANVFAVADGTVLSVEPIGLFDCPGMEISLSRACTFSIYESEFNTANFTVDQMALYQVDVSYLSGQHLSYYVAEAPTYVYEGMDIDAGCVVGKTVSAENFLDGELWGMGFVELIDEDTSEQVSLIESLVVEPDEATACNGDPAFADCLPFDPQFRNPEQWTINDLTKVRFEVSGVEIDPGGSITYSGIPLDETTAYRFTVMVQVVGSIGGTSSSGRLQLRLGESSVSHIVQSGNAHTKSVELAMHEPDEGSLYSAHIANIGLSRTLKITWNCISENTDTGPQSQCYFLNYTFDDRLNDWATYGTVSVPPSIGEVMAADDAAIGQNVYLYPDGDGPHEYTFILDWAWYVSGGDPTADEPEVQFEYRFNSDPYDEFGDAVVYRELDYSFSERTTQVVSVSDAIDGEFRLHVDIDPSGFGGTLNILLRELCIYDDFAHHPAGGGTNPGGSIPVGDDPGWCAALTRPDISSSINVGAWINYLWLRMRNFFYCTLEPLLVEIALVARDTFQVVRWQVMYWQASIDRLVNWVGFSLVPWLGGHFANMTYGQQTTIIQEAEGCNNLFCLLQSLIEQIFAPLIDLIVHYATQLIDFLYRLLNTALDLLGTVATALIRLIVEVINLITTLVQFVRLYLLAFVSAITNAQPVPMSGLPNCSEDPQSTSWCMAFYGLDKTVLANEGQLIIPVFIAVLAVTQLIWLANKVGDLIGNVGDKL